MPFATGQHGRLYWRVDGREGAPALLLLNSLGTDCSMWDQVVPLLHDSLSVLRMDTRGHGASDAPAGNYTIAGLADDALCVLDAAGCERASVCGLSLGGMIAQQLALAAPERIARVIVCNTSAEVSAQPWIDRAGVVRGEGLGAIVDAVMARFFSEGFAAEDSPYLATARRTFLSNSPEGYAACCMAISKVGLLDRVPEIRQPLLVINGRLDLATPPLEHGERIATAASNARTVTLEAGHISAMEQPGAFAEAVLDFLAAT